MEACKGEGCLGYGEGGAYSVVGLKLFVGGDGLDGSEVDGSELDVVFCGGAKVYL